MFAAGPRCPDRKNIYGLFTAGRMFPGLEKLKLKSIRALRAINDLSFRQRVMLLLGLFAVVLFLIGLLEPMPQDPGYHLFADSRTVFGIPNFNDVASNLGFAVAGIVGLVLVAGTRHTIFACPPDIRPYAIFFVAITLVSIGSAYYHWAPSNERLFWDRLPMSMAFMAISSAVVADRIDSRAGNGWLLLVMLAAGAASLIYWNWTESSGQGDLRFYALVQFYPMAALPLIIGLFPRFRYTAGRYLAWMIFWYGSAKVLEHFDGEVFALLGHTVSGHTLKHLAAAVAPMVIVHMLLAQKRSSA